MKLLLLTLLVPVLLVSCGGIYKVSCTAVIAGETSTQEFSSNQNWEEACNEWVDALQRDDVDAQLITGRNFRR